MAIYTPRGLKICFDIPSSFGLMARLEPKVTPFKVLRTTEGIELIPSMITYIVSIIAFGFDLPPLHIGIIVFASGLLALLINITGFHFIPGLVSLATVFLFFHSFGVYLIAIVITGMVLCGWEAVLAYFLAQLALYILRMAIAYWQAKYYLKTIGYPYMAPELNFLNAYRFHARKLGVTTKVDLSEDEISNQYWKKTFENFSKDWPEIVERYAL